MARSSTIVSTRRNSDADTRRKSYADIGRSSLGPALSYADVEGELLRAAVDRVATDGNAIIFGRTSDGGAFSVRVLEDKVVYKWYPADVAELRSILSALAE